MTTQKQLPQVTDLEKYVLHGIFYDNSLLADISGFLKPEMFYDQNYRNVYSTMFDMFANSKSIDPMSVVHEMRANKMLSQSFGPGHVVSIDGIGVGGDNIENNAKVIAQEWMKRELIKFSAQVSDDSYDLSSDAFELLNRIDTKVYSLYDQVLTGHSESYDEILVQATEEILKTDGSMTSGVPSGISALDRITSGFQPSDMIVLAARPAMGKSALMSKIVKNAALCGFPAAIFSLEMSKFQLICRMIAEDVEIDTDRLVKKKLTEYQKKQFIDKIGAARGLPIHIEDKPGITLIEFKAKLKQLKKKHDIQIAVIDYLQLMNGDKKTSREQEISGISRGIKETAKELNIPIIALSQLSRDTEKRGGGNIPKLSDLRESGAIEQDADMVMFLYRPEYYGITQGEDGQSVKGLADIIIAKHRNGSIENVKSEFVGRYTTFKEWEVTPF